MYSYDNSHRIQSVFQYLTTTVQSLWGIFSENNAHMFTDTFASLNIHELMWYSFWLANICEYSHQDLT